jgi:5-methylcytosine-specific restriction endonuclease McrA
VCAYCGEAIDPDAPARSPWAGSVDHVLEVSRGGRDEAGNLVACHVKCNTAKELRRRTGRTYPPRRHW